MSLATDRRDAKILNPLSQAVSALGSLAVTDAIKRSGSDSNTASEMASLIGRRRIGPVVKIPLSRDEAGTGPARSDLLDKSHTR